MIINPEILTDIYWVLAVLGAAFVVTLWISLVIWTFRDIRKRTRDSFPIAISVVVVIVFFIPGEIIYLLLRPSSTLEESFQTALEEEALLHTIEETTICPGCSQKVNPSWLVCPICHEKLQDVCTFCGKPLALNWEICPYCTKSTPKAMRKDPHPTREIPTNVNQPTQEDLSRTKQE